MPLEPMTADKPSTGPGFADVLEPNRRPALSATSDMPMRTALQPAEADPAPAEPVDKSAEPADESRTSDSPSATEGEADGQPQSKQAGEGKDKTSPQQRAAFARERNRRQEAEAQVAKRDAQIEQLLTAVSKLTETKVSDERPQRDKFETPEAYDAALEAFTSRRTTEQVRAEAKAEQERAEQLRNLDTVRSAYKKRADTFAESHDDYYDLVDADDAGFTLPMTAAILENEDGPAVAYHLAQHPEMIERIAKLTPAQTVFEIGRIAQRLATPPAPKPAPIRPLQGRSTPAEKTPEEMTMDEYAAWKKAKKKAAN